MRETLKLIGLILLLLISQYSKAQEIEEKITISFTDELATEALLKIESTTNYRFYYVEDWLGENRFSGTYSNATITDILDDLFNETVINYYLLNGTKVILTRNNIIYDQLPEGFFEEAPVLPEESEDISPVTTNPVFTTAQKRKEVIPTRTFRIGKEDGNSNKKSFKLKGFVTDNDTNAPIDNVSIIRKGTGRGTTTDDKGYYEIILPAGENMLELRSLGFTGSENRVVIYNDGSLNFLLTESLEQLDAVLIDAKAESNVEDATTGTTVIDVKKIKNIPLVLGERDILKVATTLPGIANAGEGSAGFNVRGGNADQNLFLLDDAVIYNPSHFFGIFSGINPFTTGGVTIYKGNIPAEYGGRLSSVFDLTTKDANASEFAGEASIGPVTSSLALEIPIEKDKAALLVGGRSTYSDWILRSLDDEALKNSQANFYDIVVKYNHKLGEDDQLKATGYYSKDNFSITSDSIFKYSNRAASLRWDHQFNDKHNGSVILANSQYKFNIDFDGDANNDFDLGYDITETELKLKMGYNHSEAHKFDYGISTKLYNSNPGSISPINNSIVVPVDIASERALESAIFISDEFTVSDRLLLSAGFRFSTFTALGSAFQNIYADGLPKNEGTFIESQEFGNNEAIKTYTGPEFRLSSRYFLDEALSVKASYNNTYQYIHTLTNNTTISPTDTWKLSDLNIEPQRAQQYSLGLYKNLKENEFELSLEGYYKTAENILDFKTGAQLLLNENIEREVLQGEGQAYGVEFLLRKSKGRLNGWFGYTYSRSLIKFESDFSEETINNGDYFPSNFDKPHDLSLVANYKLTQRFSLSANFVYQTGRPVTVPVGNFVINNSEFVLYSDRNEFRIPDYYRLDISLNVEGNHKIKKLAHSFWNLSIYNVLGRNNPYSVFFVNEDGQVKAFQSSIFAIPIPTITYNFQF